MSAPEPVNDRRTRPGFRRRAPARAGPRHGDERGGAISLWVVLMVPVSAFAAVVALAGPQRLAAESSVQDAADDMAMFAVAWRDGHDMSTGELPAFPPECAARSEQQNADLAMLAGNIAALDPTHSDYLADLMEQHARLNEQREAFRMKPLVFPIPDPDDPAASKVELKDRFDELGSRLKEWEGACTALSEALLRDLGYLGVDMGSLRGFYSDSLTESAMTGSCSDPQYTTNTACRGASETWTPAPAFGLPCRTSSQQTPDQDVVVVHDAVHVALTARWQDAGWAAAQVWPDGMPMAAESMGRLSRRDPAAATAPECALQLVVLDEQGRPVWAGENAAPDSRKLAQSVGRTPLSG